MDVSAAAVPPSVDSLIKNVEPKDLSKAEPCHDTKPNLPITESLEQSETAALETPQPTEAECEPETEPLTHTDTAHEAPDKKPEAPQNTSEPPKHTEVASSAPQSEANPSKSTGLDLLFPIIGA